MEATHTARRDRRNADATERVVEFCGARLTEAEARAAGLLPEQRQARIRRQVAVLQKLGGLHAESELFRALRHAAGGSR